MEIKPGTDRGHPGAGVCAHDEGNPLRPLDTRANDGKRHPPDRRLRADPVRVHRVALGKNSYPFQVGTDRETHAKTKTTKAEIDRSILAFSPPTIRRCGSANVVQRFAML